MNAYATAPVQSQRDVRLSRLYLAVIRVIYNDRIAYFPGNCTFQEITDTGIEATDYVTMMDGDVILNPPVMLRSDKE